MTVQIGKAAALKENVISILRTRTPVSLFTKIMVRLWQPVPTHTHTYLALPTTQAPKEE